MNLAELGPLVGDLRQFASVRPVVLDDGPERGVRALLFSTGGGLDFMVLVDRALDIGAMSVAGRPLAWQSAAGFASPFLADPERDGGRGFNRGFSGLLVTCGLDHVRQPAEGGPLHGKLPGTPARLLAHGADWAVSEPVLYCEGEAVQFAYGGESLRLRRRIEAPIGGRRLVIRDVVENTGPEPWPHAILYHFNFGYPAIDDGTVASLDGRPVFATTRLGDPAAERELYCLSAGAGAEAVGSIRTRGQAGTTGMSLRFATDTLPCVQFWRDTRPRVGVLALEPCSTGRLPDGTSAPSPFLAPGESVSYRLELEASFSPAGPGPGG